MSEFPTSGLAAVDPALEQDESAPLVELITVVWDSIKPPSVRCARLKFLPAFLDTLCYEERVKTCHKLKDVLCDPKPKEDSALRAGLALLPAVTTRLLLSGLGCTAHTTTTTTTTTPPLPTTPASEAVPLTTVVQDLRDTVLQSLHFLLCEGGSKLSAAALDSLAGISAALAQVRVPTTQGLLGPDPPQGPFFHKKHAAAYHVLVRSLWDTVCEVGSAASRFQYRKAAAAAAVCLLPAAHVDSHWPTASKEIAEFVRGCTDSESEPDPEQRYIVGLALQRWAWGLPWLESLQAQVQAGHTGSPLEAEAHAIALRTALKLSTQDDPCVHPFLPAPSGVGTPAALPQGGQAMGSVTPAVEEGEDDYHAQEALHRSNAVKLAGLGAVLPLCTTVPPMLLAEEVVPSLDALCRGEQSLVVKNAALKCVGVLLALLAPAADIELLRQDVTVRNPGSSSSSGGGGGGGGAKAARGPGALGGAAGRGEGKGRGAVPVTSTCSTAVDRLTQWLLAMAAGIDAPVWVDRRGGDGGGVGGEESSSALLRAPSFSISRLATSTSLVTRSRTATSESGLGIGRDSLGTPGLPTTPSLRTHRLSAAFSEEQLLAAVAADDPSLAAIAAQLKQQHHGSTLLSPLPPPTPPVWNSMGGSGGSGLLAPLSSGGRLRAGGAGGGPPVRADGSILFPSEEEESRLGLFLDGGGERGPVGGTLVPPDVLPKASGGTTGADRGGGLLMLTGIRRSVSLESDRSSGYTPEGDGEEGGPSPRAPMDRAPHILAVGTSSGLSIDLGEDEDSEPRIATRDVVAVGAGVGGTGGEEGSVAQSRLPAFSMSHRAADLEGAVRHMAGGGGRGGGATSTAAAAAGGTPLPEGSAQAVAPSSSNALAPEEDAFSDSDSDGGEEEARAGQGGGGGGSGAQRGKWGEKGEDTAGRQDTVLDAADVAILPNLPWSSEANSGSMKGEESSSFSVPSRPPLAPQAHARQVGLGGSKPPRVPLAAGSPYHHKSTPIGPPPSSASRSSGGILIDPEAEGLELSAPIPGLDSEEEVRAWRERQEARGRGGSRPLVELPTITVDDDDEEGLAQISRARALIAAHTTARAYEESSDGAPFHAATDSPPAAAAAAPATRHAGSWMGQGGGGAPSASASTDGGHGEEELEDAAIIQARLRAAAHCVPGVARALVRDLAMAGRAALQAMQSARAPGKKAAAATATAAAGGGAPASMHIHRHRTRALLHYRLRLVLRVVSRLYRAPDPDGSVTGALIAGLVDTAASLVEGVTFIGELTAAIGDGAAWMSGRKVGGKRKPMDGARLAAVLLCLLGMGLVRGEEMTVHASLHAGAQLLPLLPSASHGRLLTAMLHAAKVELNPLPPMVTGGSPALKKVHLASLHLGSGTRSRTGSGGGAAHEFAAAQVAHALAALIDGTDAHGILLPSLVAHGHGHGHGAHAGPDHSSSTASHSRSRRSSVVVPLIDSRGRGATTWSTKDNVGWRVRATFAAILQHCIPHLEVTTLANLVVPAVLSFVLDPVACIRAPASHSMATALGALWHYAQGTHGRSSVRGSQASLKGATPSTAVLSTPAKPLPSMGQGGGWDDGGSGAVGLSLSEGAAAASSATTAATSGVLSPGVMFSPGGLSSALPLGSPGLSTSTVGLGLPPLQGVKGTGSTAGMPPPPVPSREGSGAGFAAAARATAAAQAVPPPPPPPVPVALGTGAHTASGHSTVMQATRSAKETAEGSLHSADTLSASRAGVQSSPAVAVTRGAPPAAKPTAKEGGGSWFSRWLKLPGFGKNGKAQAALPPAAAAAAAPPAPPLASKKVSPPGTAAGVPAPAICAALSSTSTSASAAPLPAQGSAAVRGSGSEGHGSSTEQGAQEQQAGAARDLALHALHHAVHALQVCTGSQGKHQDRVAYVTMCRTVAGMVPHAGVAGGLPASVHPLASSATQGLWSKQRLLFDTSASAAHAAVHSLSSYPSGLVSPFTAAVVVGAAYTPYSTPTAPAQLEHIPMAWGVNTAVEAAGMDVGGGGGSSSTSHATGVLRVAGGDGGSVCWRVSSEGLRALEEEEAAWASWRCKQGWGGTAEQRSSATPSIPDLLATCKRHVYEQHLKHALLRLLKTYKPESYWWKQVAPLAGEVALNVALKEWEPHRAREKLELHLNASLRKQRAEEVAAQVAAEASSLAGAQARAGQGGGPGGGGHGGAAGRRSSLPEENVPVSRQGGPPPGAAPDSAEAIVGLSVPVESVLPLSPSAGQQGGESQWGERRTQEIAPSPPRLSLGRRLSGGPTASPSIKLTSRAEADDSEVWDGVAPGTYVPAQKGTEQLLQASKALTSNRKRSMEEVGQQPQVLLSSPHGPGLGLGLGIELFPDVTGAARPPAPAPVPPPVPPPADVARQQMQRGFTPLVTEKMEYGGGGFR